MNAATTWELARSYKIAADRLLILMGAEHLPLRDPTYFLYAHAAELALKALLLAHRLQIPTSGKKGHEIGDIYERCRDEKLIGLDDPHFELHNVIAMLSSGNYGHSYRYGGQNGRIRPALDWASEGVGRLMQLIESHVHEWIKDHGPAPSNRRLAFGKPKYKKQPVPTNLGPG